ncbi:MAG: tetratricopeptide repeat protein [Bacteroidales bacterium]|nr:tetratricopeptide repeat protein [Bacteroidales bacterium]MDD5974821.1 tetratricopeptide repeat protein [Bacteroidales bacterium]
MSKKKQKIEEADGLENVEKVVSTGEQFLEKYRKQIIICLSVILVVAIGIVLFRTQYLVPRNEDAATKLSKCIYYIEQDSFNLALNGDALNEGLLDIIDEYGVTKTADLACIYAGICYYNLNDYQSACTYFEKFNKESVNVQPANLTIIGDCYVEMDNIEKAIKYFEKAAKQDNELTAPRALNKAGICYEKLGNYKKAEECYQTIKDKYFNSSLAVEMDKRIEYCRSKQ